MVLEDIRDKNLVMRLGYMIIVDNFVASLTEHFEVHKKREHTGTLIYKINRNHKDNARST